MRAFAVQFLYLLRAHAAEAAHPEVWISVEKLEGALRCERWPELGGDWKAVGLTRFWEDVTRAVRRAPGDKLRRYDVLDAVSAAMKAVGSARNADRDAAKSVRVSDVRAHLWEAAACAEKACQIASELGAPMSFFEPLRALLPRAPST